MDKGYIEKRKEELTEEFKKGQEALSELQGQANKVSEQMKQIQGAYAELVNQEKELTNGDSKKDSKKK